MPEAQGWRL